MDTRLNKLATATGAAIVGLALAHPGFAQSYAGSEWFGASPAHSSCDALQGPARIDCLFSHSSPSVTESGGAVGRADRFRSEALAGESASAGADLPEASASAIQRQGANPANLLCDPLQGATRADCLAAFSAGGGLQQGF
jgi:hypothetical protein